MLKHLPGEPVEGIQSCVRCGLVLIDWSGDDQQAAVPIGSYDGPMWWNPGHEIVTDGAFSGTAGEAYPDVATCAPTVS